MSFLTTTVNVAKADIGLDDYIDTSDNEDSEDASTCRSLNDTGEQTDNEDRVVMDLNSCP